MRTIVWLVFAACSSGPGTPTHPTKPPPTSTHDAGARTPAQSPPSSKECELLVTHVVELTLREHPAEPAPSAAEMQAIDQPLRSFVTECTALSREAYRCGMEATSLVTVTACHATPSSSTSNSSVAPPGITPPAPRSP